MFLRPIGTRFVALLFALLVVTSLLPAAVAAQEDTNPDWADELYEDTRDMTDKYNEEIQEQNLGPAKGILANENINLVITDDGSNATFSFRTDGELRIQDLTKGKRDNATLRMTTSRETAERLNEAEQPAVVFKNAVSSGEIEIEGLTFTKQITWSITSSIGRALGILG